MGTIPTNLGAAKRGQQQVGVPVLGNRAGNNQYSPINQAGGGLTVPGGLSPIKTLDPTKAHPLTSSLPAGISGQTATPINTTPVATKPTVGSAGTTQQAVNTATGATLAGYTPHQTQQLQKQLIDIYGKGEGGLLFSLLSNLGGNDSAYMDAYHKAMGKTQAEGLATIDTGLGNAGISADSSTAAIEKADYLSGLGAQEGLQEQQLILQQQQEAISLTQGLQNDARDENSTSWLNTLADVGNAAAPFVDIATGGASGAISNLFKKSIPTLDNGSTSASRLPGAISGGAPSFGTGLTIPGVSDGSLSDLTGLLG